MNWQDSTQIAKSEAKQWSRVRMAHEAMMLDDARQLLAQSRRQVASHAKSLGIDGAAAGADDVGDISIGDTIYIGDKPKQPSALSTMAKAAIAGAGLLGAAGLGVAAYSSYFTRPEPPAPIDTDTQAVGGFRILREPPTNQQQQQQQQQ